MEKKRKKINKISEWFLIIIFGAIINVFCVLLFSCTAKAETINPLPYYVNAYYSDYFHLTSSQLDVITSYTGSQSNYFFWFTEPYEWNNNYYATRLCGYYMGETNTVSLKANDLTTNVDYNMFDMDNDFVVVSKNGGTYVKKIVLINKSTGAFSYAEYSLPVVRSANLLHLSTKTINEYGFTPNVPFVFQSENPLLWQGSNDQIIFTNGQPVPPTPEDENITDNTVKPSFNDYQVDWTTGKPSFDTNNPMESLFDYFSWFSGKIGDTLVGGWNFIVDSLDWSLQTFLNNVRAKFNEIKESVNDFADMVEDKVDIVNGYLSDLKDYVSDIKTDLEEFADLFIHPFDEEEFEVQMANSEFLNAYDEFTANADIVSSIFDNAEERDHFSLYISFENPFADSQHRIIASEINFDWLVPLRSVYRPFLWVCTLIELFVGGARVLTHVLGGKGV